MIPRPIAFIINPLSGSGRGKRWLGQHQEEILESFPDSRFLATEHPGHEKQLSREAAIEGARLVVAVTGDGGLSPVAEGILESGTGAALGVVRAGTGGDFGRSLGLPVSDDWSLSSFSEGELRPIDLIQVDYRNHQEESAQKLVVNIASFGIGGHVVQAVNNSSKRGGGFLSFFWASLRSLLHFRNPIVRLQIDKRDLPPQPIFNVAIANGRAFGGGMLIAPKARLDDARLDLVILSNRGFGQSLRLAPSLYRGTHLSQPWVQWHAFEKLKAQSSESVLLECDGEWAGHLPATFQILKGAILLWAPHSRPQTPTIPLTEKPR
jgi:YegS/Rv2252/BmrU family lipid kinase